MKSAANWCKGIMPNPTGELAASVGGKKIMLIGFKISQKSRFKTK
jgi:hypothetical protein